MRGRTSLALLPGFGADQRLEVSLVQRRDGRVAIELCEQHYAEGIGWFDQRSLELEPRQWRQLEALLGQSGPQIRAAEADAPAIVPFPGPRAAAPRRRAVGDER